MYHHVDKNPILSYFYTFQATFVAVWIYVISLFRDKQLRKFNRIDHLPLEVKYKGKRYSLISLAEKIPSEDHFRSHVLLKGQKYTYDPYLFPKKGQPILQAIAGFRGHVTSLLFKREKE